VTAPGRAPATGPVTLRRVIAVPRAHVPALDGLRGIAILLVVFHHAWFNLPATTLPDLVVQRLAYFGWAGVDLFFVLSGFLITGILLDTRESQHYFRNFYMRRVLRIFPAYYAFLALLFFVLPRTGLMYPEEAARLSAHQPWYWSYTVNVLLGREGWPATPWNTGHLWSLAVEEQFYLVWPMLVFLLPRRRLMWLAAATIVGAFVLRLFLRGDVWSPVGVQVLTLPRLDTLAMGAFLAIQVRQPGGLDRMTRWARPAIITGGVVIVTLLALTRFSSQGPIMQMAGYSAIAFVAGGLLIRAINDESRGRRLRALWRHPVMRFFGRYSYCIYIVHYPIVLLVARYAKTDRIPAVAGSFLPGNLAFLALVVLTSTGVALVSWHLLEKHFLRLKDRFAQ
jgi:peptidoglycan/LPS O-acetylase OafA/YrhL